MPARRRASTDGAQIREQQEAIRYTNQWFAVYDWTTETLDNIPGFDWGRIPDNFQRMIRVRATIRQLDNEEVAYKRALPIVAMLDWLQRPGPGREEGGRRRVVIRIFCWAIDRKNEAAHDGKWIRVADDMSAHASRARARRWATQYDRDLAIGDVSRELRMTAIEIAFWTQTIKARNL